MSLAVIGIDPGVNGAMCLLTADGQINVVDWPGTIMGYADVLSAWAALWDIKLVAIERVTILPRDSKRSGATFMRHCGEITAMLILARMPCAEVSPQKWGKGLLRAKTHARDKPSVEFVKRMFPSVELTGPRGGVKDGRSDAVMIAYWALRHTEGKC